MSRGVCGLLWLFNKESPMGAVSLFGWVLFGLSYLFVWIMSKLVLGACWWEM